MGTTKIDRARVADTALRLLNEVGLDGLTLRAIARELDVKAPALYWHFKDKQALLDEMATVMYRRMLEGELPGPAPRSWQQQMVAYQRALRCALLRYRDGAKVYSGARFTGTDHADGLEAHLRTMVDAGFELWQAVRAGTTVNAYTMGFVTEEQGVQPMPDERRDGYDVDERAERLKRYPLAAAAGAEIFTHYDERFEDGLWIVVAGIEARYGVT
ncbi:TetR/AcrR family transcriptional regulator C-terminal domain-containing protein [Streptomyces sp. NBC_00059]|uniref:TetR/AcrR family transcriptional regulator C-terminal domain-containing protein n=1 Tax=Streptomyces sp. NBC_00059 TaxID=2975635 RepID=UPI00224CE223|nr:TetR/AcrR family transcriptional regulator C-terminal domain-containing protein [Streptomyces sp. NBC_00059]MCX5410563.1 TetR/AcrR family transcriptional regulator C-terminal domain-containing protein [Streptomyces sp. NBC_00059]